MASSRVLLLLALLAAAAAAFRPVDAAAAPQCEPEVLATTVSLSCATRQPTEWCCQALVHAARVGCVGCLCRLAASSPLVAAAMNATDLLGLYGACAGSPPSNGGATSASVCDEGGGAAPSPSDTSGCAAGSLADQMELFCGRSDEAAARPAFPCCEAVVASVRKGADGVPCFCRVAQLSSSSFGVARIAGLYAACHGSVRGSLAAMCPRLPDPNMV